MTVKGTSMMPILGLPGIAGEKYEVAYQDTDDGSKQKGDVPGGGEPPQCEKTAHLPRPRYSAPSNGPLSFLRVRTVPMPMAVANVIPTMSNVCSVRARRISGRPNEGSPVTMVGPDRLELSTSVLSGPRSNHLSYGPQYLPRIIAIMPVVGKSKPESTEGGRRVSVLKRQEGAPVLLG